MLVRKVPIRGGVVNSHSFDFHDCLFNKQWFEMMKDFKYKPHDSSFAKYQEFALIKSNKNIINWVKEIAHSTQSNKVNLMLGSACQSYIDDRRHRLNGIRDIPQASVFSGLKILHNTIANEFNSKNISVELEPFILADVFDDLTPGTSFKLALEAAEDTSKKIRHANWVLDDTKMIILYGQMHKIASACSSDTEIFYHFFDDKKEIIDNLFNFFNSHRVLIPQNVTLNLNQYSGEIPNVLHQLTGKGPSDEHYYSSIKKIVELCGYEHDFISISRLTRVFNPTRFSLFKEWRYKQLGYKSDAKAVLPITPFSSLIPQNFSQTFSFFKEHPSNKKTMKAIAIDFDRCAYSELYTARITKARLSDSKMSWGTFLEVQNEILISENINLFNHLTVEIKETRDLYQIQVLLSSARQSFKSDTINVKHERDINGSAFQGLLMLRNRIEYEIHKLKKKVVVEVNHFLLADLYAALDHGKSFRRALLQMHNESKTWKADCEVQIPKNYFDGHADWVFDDSKITIVYAHVHKLSFENPATDIMYDFYDDRSDILEDIKKFFEMNLDLIPIGVTVSLNQYRGSDIKKIGSLKGQGRTDQYYDKSIKKLVKLSGNDMSNYSEIINIFKLLQIDNRITTFKEWREENISSNNIQEATLVA